MSLLQRQVVVTGATGGLGGAVVRELARLGAACHLPVRGQASAELRAIEGVTVHAGVDVGSESDLQSFYGSLPVLWASIHLVGGFAMAPIEATTLEDLDAMLRLNLTTCFLCCRAAIGRMNEGGRIVNVGARPALAPVAGMTAYTLSKAAVMALSSSLAAEVRDRKILVNTVVPSIIDTPQNRQAMPNADHGAWPTPAQVAKTIAFLASTDNQLVSGANIPVYGRV